MALWKFYAQNDAKCINISPSNTYTHIHQLPTLECTKYVDIFWQKYRIVFVYLWYLMTICPYQTSLGFTMPVAQRTGPLGTVLASKPKELGKIRCWNVEWNIMWCQAMPHRSWLHQSSKQSVAFKRLARNLSICGFPILFQLPPIAGRQLEKVPSFLSWTSGPPTWKIGRSVFLLCFSLAWAFTLNLRTGLAANDCLVHDANPASSSHKTWKGHCKGLFYILQLQHISFQEGRGTWRKSP